MSYHLDSNYKTVLAGIKADLASAIDEKVMRTAGLTAVAVILNRNQQQGKNSDGSKRQSKSSKTVGAYSAGYAKKRRKKGRQIDLVDLTMSGDMLRNFNLIAADKNSAEVGFMTDAASQIAEYNEAYYGEMFILSDSEEMKVMAGAEKEIQAKFKP
jgi:hypothetical protein